jgi:hypothetical protein
METIKGRTDIVRDPSTRAIINVDVASHETAVAASKARQLAKEQIKINTNDINSIRDELSDIKSLLKQLVDRNG